MRSPKKLMKMKWRVHMTPTGPRIWLHLFLLVVTLVLSTGELQEDVHGGAMDDTDIYLNAFAIKLKDRVARDVAEKVARDHGFRLTTELQNSGVFILEHPEISSRSKRNVDGHVEALRTDPRVEHAQQEILLHRVKRRIFYDKQLELPIRQIDDNSIFKRYPSVFRRDNINGVEGGNIPTFKDPLYKDMWYLNNQGQSGGENGLDLNIGVAWKQGFTGKGVVVTILDDGVDHTHPDLKDNYDPEASTDLNDKYDDKDDPMPDTSDDYNSHGTRCAGEVAAAANNNVCGLGVAFHARIGGVRILDGPISDALEAEAISFNRNYIDIYSASWGPSDDGATMEGPKHLALGALVEGVKQGRNGLGSIFVWATGNGGGFGDDCSADGYVSRPETLSVGSVNDWGRSPFFMENCSSTLAVVPSGGEDYKGQEDENEEVKLKVITTDFRGKCIENFQGTSSAAPLAAGCLANVLQANPNLSWRDMQHVVIQGSRIPSTDTSWIINGAGHHVSHRFGFGLMDCGRMVGLAQNWEPVPERLLCNSTKQSYRPLKFENKVSDVIMSDGCLSDSHNSQSGAIDRLEHVQVYLKMTSRVRGEISIHLISPAGTRSTLLSPRQKDDYEGEWEFMFMTVHSWDESPRGKWTLEVHHKPRPVSSYGSSKTKARSKLDILKEKLDGHTPSGDGSRNKAENSNADEVVGYVREWSLSLHGTHGTRHGRTSLSKSRTQKAYRPSTDDVEEIKKREAEMSRKVKVSKASQKGDSRDPETSSPGRAAPDRADNLAELIWTLLHKHGAKDVRKRVLQNNKSDQHIRDYPNASSKPNRYHRVLGDAMLKSQKSDRQYVRSNERAHSNTLSENLEELEEILQELIKSRVK